MQSDALAATHDMRDLWLLGQAVPDSFLMAGMFLQVVLAQYTTPRGCHGLHASAQTVNCWRLCRLIWVCGGGKPARTRSSIYTEDSVTGILYAGGP